MAVGRGFEGFGWSWCLRLEDDGDELAVVAGRSSGDGMDTYLSFIELEGASESSRARQDRREAAEGVAERGTRNSCTHRWADGHPQSFRNGEQRCERGRGRVRVLMWWRWRCLNCGRRFLYIPHVDDANVTGRRGVMYSAVYKCGTALCSPSRPCGVGKAYRRQGQRRRRAVLYGDT